MRNRLRLVLTLAVAAVILISFGSISALAEKTGTCGDAVEWTLSDEGILTITGTGAMTEYTSYTKVPWYSSRLQITKVEVEEGVTAIAPYAFYNCSAVTEVSIPDTVTSLGKYAFYGCSKLPEAVVPDSVKTMGTYCFAYCSELTQIDMPEEMESMGSYCFYNDAKLTSIVVPDGVTELLSYTFTGCVSLTEATVPHSVTSIANPTFHASPVVTTIKGYKYSAAEIFADTYSYPFESIGEMEYAVIEEGSVNEDISWKYDSHRTLTITGTGAIPDYSSYSETPWAAYRLKTATVVVEEGITTIGKYALSYHTVLKNVSLPETLTAINGFAFIYDRKLVELELPSSLVSIGKEAFQNCTSLAWITIPPSVETIEGEIFYNSTPTVRGYTASVADVYCRTNDIAFESIGELEYELLCEGETGEGISWTLDNRWVLKISGTGEIPDYTETGAPWKEHVLWIGTILIEDGITAVGENSFFEAEYAEKAVIGDSVVKIGVSAFENCKKLTEVEFGASVSEIENAAFAGCKALDGIVLPESVTEIKANTFNGCSALTEIVISEGVTEIGAKAFLNCSSLEKITLPSSLTAIGDAAFRYCTKLTEITIPDSVESLGESAFENCSLLESAVISQKISEIPQKLFQNSRVLKSVEFRGDVTKIGEYAFYYTGIEEITLPDTVKEIGSYAFQNCKSLTAVDLGDGLELVGDGVFTSCSALEEITLPDTLGEIGEGMFSSCSALKRVDFPAGITKIPAKMFYLCTSLKNDAFSIPDTVEEIGSSAFYGGNMGDTLTIKGHIKVIGSHAFESNKMKSLVIEEGTEIIDSSAFSSCTQLSSVSLPDSLQGIYSYAFYKCTALTEIVIPAGVTEIGGNAFYYCTALSSVTVNGAVESIGEQAFMTCKALKDFTINGSVKAIGEKCFYNCTSLESLDLRNGVMTLGDEAFSNCTALKSVKLGEMFSYIPSSNKVFYKCTSAVIYGYSNTPIEDYAEKYNMTFYSLGKATEGVVFVEGTIGEGGVWSLTNLGLLTISGTGALPDYSLSGSTPWSTYNDQIKELVVEEGITDIGSYIFGDMTALTHASLKSSGKIGTYAFRYCTALIDVDARGGVTSIGEYAFWKCSALTGILLPDSMSEIGKSAFSGCSALASITIPEGITTLNSTAFTGCSKLHKVWLPKSLREVDSDIFSASAEMTIEGYTGSLAEAVALQNSYAFNGYEGMEKDVILEEKVSGGVKYTLMSYGVLNITGTGTVSYIGTSWPAFVDTVIFSMGVTSVSDSILKNSPNVTIVTIPYTVVSVTSGFLTTLPDGVTIAGYTNSYAERVAKNAGISFMGGAVMPDVVLTEGSINGFEWSVTSYGVLTITGSGELTIQDVAAVGIYRAYTEEVVLGEGIEKFSTYCFGTSYFPNVRIFRTPSTVTSVSDYGWPNADTLTVYCYKYSAAYDLALEDSVNYVIVGTSPEWVKKQGSFDNFTWQITNHRYFTLSGEGVIEVSDPYSWRAYSSYIENWIIEGKNIYIKKGAIPEYSALKTIYGYSNTTAEVMAETIGVEFVSLGEVEAGTAILSGVFEDTSVSYELTNEGIMRITGTGDMPDGDGTNNYIFPWLLYDYMPVYEVYISDGVTSVGKYSFFSKNSVHTISLGADVERIGAAAFCGAQIKEIDLPEGLTEIGGMAFSDCIYLEQIKIPAGVKVINSNTFDNCIELTRIQIPRSVTEIRKDAFRYTNLRYVYYLGTTPEWENNVDGKEYLPEDITVFYSREIPENVTFEVTNVKKTSAGAEINIEATLQGGECLVMAAYDADGTLIGIRRIEKSGSYYKAFEGKVKQIKVFIWDSVKSLTPVPEARYYVRNF